MSEDLGPPEALGPAPVLPAFPRAGACVGPGGRHPYVSPPHGAESQAWAPPTRTEERLLPLASVDPFPTQLPGTLQLGGDQRELEAGA